MRRAGLGFQCCPPGVYGVVGRLQVHVVGATEETVVVILEEDAPPAPAVGPGVAQPPVATISAPPEPSAPRATRPPQAVAGRRPEADPTGSSSSSGGSPGAAGPWDGAAGALAVRDRRAALAHQSAVIAGMQQVSQGKLVIILDQDGMDAAELAKLLRTNGAPPPCRPSPASPFAVPLWWGKADKCLDVEERHLAQAQLAQLVQADARHPSPQPVPRCRQALSGRTW